MQRLNILQRTKNNHTNQAQEIMIQINLELKTRTQNIKSEQARDWTSVSKSVKNINKIPGLIIQTLQLQKILQVNGDLALINVKVSSIEIRKYSQALVTMTFHQNCRMLQNTEWPKNCDLIRRRHQ